MSKTMIVIALPSKADTENAPEYHKKGIN